MIKDLQVGDFDFLREEKHTWTGTKHLIIMVVSNTANEAMHPLLSSNTTPSSVTLTGTSSASKV